MYTDHATNIAVGKRAFHSLDRQHRVQKVLRGPGERWLLLSRDGSGSAVAVTVILAVVFAVVTAGERKCVAAVVFVGCCRCCSCCRRPLVLVLLLPPVPTKRDPLNKLNPEEEESDKDNSMGSNDSASTKSSKGGNLSELSLVFAFCTVSCSNVVSL